MAFAGFTSAQTSQPAAAESTWLRNIRQVTQASMGLDRAGEAYFSPDAKRICFQAYPKGKTDYQIYVMNLDGSGLQMVSTGDGATTCAYFHPDGKRLLFASNHLDPRPAGVPEDVKAAGGGRSYAWSFFPGMDVYECDLSDKKLKRLIDAPGYDAEGSYSPDGKLIVFTSMRDNDQEVYICRADGSQQRRITSAKGYDGGPFFSPDGKRIVYRSDRNNDGNMAIYTNNLEGTAEKAITDASVLHWCPYWHPSGKWLIYTRADHKGRPNYDLYLIRDDGSQEMQVTSDAAFDGLPVFSPDGKQVMWTSKRGGLDGAQIFVADFAGLSREGEMLIKP